MLNFSDLIKHAKQIGSTEFSISSGAKPIFRKNNKWINSEFGKLNPGWIRETIFSLLDDEMRKDFIQKGCISNYIDIDLVSLRYTLSQTSTGFNGYFCWDNRDLTIEDFALPQAAVEIIKKSSGVSLLTGPQSSGKSTLLRLLAKRLADSGLRVAIMADLPFFFESTLSDNNTIQVFDVQRNQCHVLTVGSGFDIIILDTVNVLIWNQAISLGNRGAKVLMTLPFQTAEIAMRRLSEEISQDEKIGRSRIVDSLQMVIGQRLLEGVSSTIQTAHEILYVTHEVRSLVRQGDWLEVEKLMGASSDSLGMTTLNQSLLNLMLKRKIDLKVGFAESNRPEELDRMFEKIGL